MGYNDKAVRRGIHMQFCRNCGVSERGTAGDKWDEPEGCGGKRDSRLTRREARSR